MENRNWNQHNDSNDDWNDNNRQYYKNRERSQQHGQYGNTNYNRNNPDYNNPYGYNPNNNRQDFEDRRNDTYGSVYHGNVSDRERETNRAQGGRYMNRDSNSNYGNAGNYRRNWDHENSWRQGNDYNNDAFNRNEYTSHYRDSNPNNYGNMNYNRGDRDWWDRTSDEVSSWFGDDDAERRRDLDKRMAGAHKGKGPKGYKRSDERIHEDICDRLSDDHYVDASDVDIKVEGSEVILTGHVNSRHEKRRAEDIVESVSGVTHVENRLRVNWDKNDDRTSDNDDDRARNDMNKYTGMADSDSGVGTESGTMNEIIRNSGRANK